MGMFNTYGDHQLKVGESWLACYKIGDKVEIADGVYICPTGVVVIANSIFIYQSNTIKDKYGKEVTFKNYDFDLCNILFGDK